MKTIKVLTLMFAATIIAFQANAQSAKAAEGKSEVRQAGEAPRAASATERKIEKTTVKAETKVAKTEAKAAAKTEKKVVDGRTKTGDKVFHDKKGPNGETVYKGPKGGFYYLDKKENKVYIK